MSEGTTCDICGFDNDSVCKIARVEMVKCEACDRTICAACLADMAKSEGTVSASDAAAIIASPSGAYGFMLHCEESDMDMCPECFENEPGE